MFTDIVGYSAIMDADEEKAFDYSIRIETYNDLSSKTMLVSYLKKWLNGILASFSP